VKSKILNDFEEHDVVALVKAGLVAGQIHKTFKSASCTFTCFY